VIQDSNIFLKDFFIKIRKYITGIYSSLSSGRKTRKKDIVKFRFLINLKNGLTNNDIFKKLRVAHKLRDDQIVEICNLTDYKISKSDLGAFFRNEKHEKYMECGDHRS
jgi:uncharacterized protein YehS (DUF1456 family)